MNREHHRWYSPSLERDMELLVFGHAGARVLVFPTSMGSFFQWEDTGMIATLSDQLENGDLQLFCVDRDYAKTIGINVDALRLLLLILLSFRHPA